MSARRALALLAATIVGGTLIAIWLFGRGGDAPRERAGTAGNSERKVPRAARTDARHLTRVSISGIVTDDQHAAVPDARVCATASSQSLPHVLTRDPRCVNADARGGYRLDELYVAEYVVAAMAEHHPPKQVAPFELRAGEQRTVDILLPAGGVEVTGTVSDLGGGAIGRARVKAFSMTTWGRAPTIDTDDRGTFRLWMWPGSIGVEVVADGYADTMAWGAAPGTFHLKLTPEASLTGTVVDARTNAPVAGATVTLANSSNELRGSTEALDTTDEQGQFRIDRLYPGRYHALAVSSRGFGRGEGSVLVPLGQAVTGALVRLHPAVNIEGKLLVDGAAPKPCEKPSLGLSSKHVEDNLWSRAGGDGAVTIDGVLPGSYEVRVDCDGFALADGPTTLEVGDRDVTGLVWRFREGATIRGHVRDVAGHPIGDASVSATASGTEHPGGGHDTSKPDGSYQITGLSEGKYWLNVTSYKGIDPGKRPKIELGAGAAIIQDVVLEEGGQIVGVVKDSDGNALAGVQVTAFFRDYVYVRSAEDGTFRFDNAPSGEQLVLAESAGEPYKRERVIVRPAAVTTVNFVFAPRNGKITGTVVDANGKPVGDAFVDAMREVGDNPGSIPNVLTGVDGGFSLLAIPSGTYRVNANRLGAGEATVEHVQTGGHVQIQLKGTGSIAGTIRGGSEALEARVQVNDARTGITRTETFYRTGGRYHLDDLPPGSYVITGASGAAEGQAKVELVEGAHLTGIDVTLDPSATLAGRVVDLMTKAPVPNATVFATLVGGYEDHSGKTDSDGRFVLDGIPRGRVTLYIGATDYRRVEFKRDVAAASTDIGDVAVIKSPRGETGKLGVTFDDASMRIAAVDPTGPAAKAGVGVGDTVVTIDGTGVATLEHDTAMGLLAVPVGTAVHLGLARGVTIAVVTVPRER